MCIPFNSQLSRVTRLSTADVAAPYPMIGGTEVGGDAHTPQCKRCGSRPLAKGDQSQKGTLTDREGRPSPAVTVHAGDAVAAGLCTVDEPGT